MPVWVTSNHHRAIVDALTAARKRAGLTQRGLASRLHKPASFIAKIELVERNISVLELVAICDAIGVEPSAILAAARGTGGPVEL